MSLNGSECHLRGMQTSRLFGRRRSTPDADSDLQNLDIRPCIASIDGIKKYGYVSRSDRTVGVI